jgi:ankyrin
VLLVQASTLPPEPKPADREVTAPIKQLAPVSREGEPSNRPTPADRGKGLGIRDRGATPTIDAKGNRRFIDEIEERAVILGWAPVHVAVVRGDMEGLRELIRQGAALDVKDLHGRTPVELAAENDQDDLVRLLVANGSAVSTLFVAAAGGNCEQVRSFHQPFPAVSKVRNEKRSTPLAIAVRRGDLAVVKLMLEMGADPNAPDAEGRTLLQRATDDGHWALAHLLLEYKASVNEVLCSAVGKQQVGLVRWLLENTPRLALQSPVDEGPPLLLAAESGNLEIARLLLGAGTPVDAPTSKGRTPLHGAVESGNVEMVRLLLHFGASIAPQSRSEDPPLHLAITRGDVKMVEFLLAHNADPTATSQRTSRTPLHDAVLVDSLEIARILLAHGADVDALDAYPRTPLLWAIDRAVRHEDHDLPLVRLLLDHGAHVNTQPDARAPTPLLLAVRQEDHDLVRRLLSAGAKVDLADQDERTALNEAVRRNDIACARELLEAKANPRAVARRADDLEPIHIAASHTEGTATVALLLDHGADINAREKDLGWEQERGRTALHFAVENENVETVALLLKRGADWKAEDRNGGTAVERALKVDNDAIFAVFRKAGALR